MNNSQFKKAAKENSIKVYTCQRKYTKTGEYEYTISYSFYLTEKILSGVTHKKIITGTYSDLLNILINN